MPYEDGGFKDDDVVVKWKNCPDCNGRGWFLIRPFATGGGNGVGGIQNCRQCETCKNAHEQFLAVHPVH